MNILIRKMRSRSGVSMMLVLVFLLFCSFVGSAVLASAVSNSRRVSESGRQQEFLSEQSAAELVADRFRLNLGEYLILTVQDSVKAVREMRKVGNGGTFEETGRETVLREITFRVNTNITPNAMHRLLLETAVYGFLCELPQDAQNSDIRIRFENFPGDPESTGDFLLRFNVNDPETEIGGTLEVAASAYQNTDVTIPSYTVGFLSGRGEERYDFFLYFGDQMKITLDAGFGTQEPLVMEFPVSSDKEHYFEAAASYIRITETLTRHTVSWENPLIEKGAGK